MPKRVSRLRLATSDGQPAFAIEDGDWVELEVAYRRAIPPDVRQAILEATTGFITFEPAERLAEPVAAAIKRIASLEIVAQRLFLELNAPPTDASTVADARIAWTMGRRHLAAFHRGLEDFGAACRQVRGELEAERREGDKWADWVRRLTAICRAQGWPTGAPSYQENERALFVALVDKLQLLLPEPSRRHGQSREGLAKAIQRARRRGCC